MSVKKAFHESNYTLVVVFRLNFLKNSQKVNKNTEKVNSSIMVDELLLAINPEYSVRSNLTFLQQICTLRITISTTTLYIYVYYTVSLSHRDISSIFATHAQSIPKDRMHARYCATRNEYHIY